MRLSGPTSAARQPRRPNDLFREDSDARLPKPHLRGLDPRRCRERRPPVGLGAPGARSRRALVHRLARPLRHHPDRRRPRFACLRRGRDGARRMGDPRRRRGARPPGRYHQPQPADRRDRGLCPRHRGAVGGRRVALAGVRRARLSGRPAPQVPLPRSQARNAARQHHEAHADHRRHARGDGEGGLFRVLHPHPHRLQPRGGARLPGALAPACGKVLCPAAGPAAVQAACHDVGLRPLFPDRAVLSRRGPARRPPAGRVLPARHRDELRHPGRRLRRHGTGPAQRLYPFRRGQAGDASASRALPMPTSSAATAPTSRTCATPSSWKR